MLDIKFVRKNPEIVTQAIIDKKEKCELQQILDLDATRREKLAKVEELKQQRNQQSEKIGRAKRDGADVSEWLQEMGTISQTIKELDREITEIDRKLEADLLWLPNLPAPDVPRGSAADNQIVRSYGQVKKHDFPARPHWKLGEHLQILDIQRAARLSGSGFTMFTGIGARLERALLSFMLDTHREHGYYEIAPPLLVNRKTITGSGQLPKLENDMYFVGQDELYLIPTSEVPLINYYQDEIIPGEKLPCYLMSATPCFRREAGAHGKDTRGLLRVHQFNKVELIHFATPEESKASLEKMLGHAETILQKLAIPYRIVALASGDLSFAAAKTYDIEIWASGVERWLEVSSCSNCGDFQARRANIRYKFKKGKTCFVHTLNGSGVAIPRLMVALLENYQRQDGSVEIPEVLQPYLGGMTQIVKL